MLGGTGETFHFGKLLKLIIASWVISPMTMIIVLVSTLDTLWHGLKCQIRLIRLFFIIFVVYFSSIDYLIVI